MNTSYAEGYAAHDAGRMLEDCPYEGEDATSWEEGWVDAEADQLDDHDEV